MPRPALQVTLLENFRLEVDCREVVLPGHAQRLLAYLALYRATGTTHRRTALADRLWCDAPMDRAQARLRTALWRVHVDVERSLAQAARLLAEDPTSGDADCAGLTGDLLPGWDDVWLVVERERIRQIRIHALVALSVRLRRQGRFLPALDAAYRAITAEPLNESAHAALIEIHLAEGDVVEARRQMDRYAALLWQEMRLRPTEALLARVP